MKINIKEPKLGVKLNVQTVYPSLEDLEVTATTEEQVFTHPNSYGYDKVTVSPISVRLQDKVVTPTTSSQTITADEGYTALENVVVNAVTSDIDSNIIASNIKNGVSILGVTGNISGDSFSEFIKVGDNLRNKTIVVDKDYVYTASRQDNMLQFILLNNTSIDDAENDAGDFIKKDDYLKNILIFLEDEGIEYHIYNDENKISAGYKFSDDRDYIVTYIDSNMSNIFKIGYTKNEDFEFEKVSSNSIARGTTISGVVGNAPDEFDMFLQGTLAVGDDYINPRITSLPNGMFSGTSFDSFTKKIIFPNVTQMGLSTFYPANNITGLELPELLSNTFASYIIMSCTKLKYIYAPQWVVNCSGPMRGNTACETIDFRMFYEGRTIGSYAFQNLNSLTKMIIRGPNVVAMTSTSNNLYSSPLFTGNGCLYVKPDLVNTYKTATNWSAMATRIYPFYLATSVEDITTKLNDNTIPVGSLIIYDAGTYETNRYTVKTGGN